MKLPTFTSKQQRIAWLVQNREEVISLKMAEMKRADAVHYPVILPDLKGEAAKAEGIGEDITRLMVKAVINTTNLRDGHDDVHIPGLWRKSLSENRNIMHLQEHAMTFDKIISDRKDLTAETVTMTWKELGFDYPGTTEALMFNSNVKRTRNAYMFEQYKEGNVTNHSVGMRYVKLFMCVDDKQWKEEHQNWEKYIEYVANKDETEEAGFFFAVTEAKIIEGSAVPSGSNWITPTLETEPLKGTPAEPPDGTQKSLIELINKRKILI